MMNLEQTLLENEKKLQQFPETPPPLVKKEIKETKEPNLPPDPLATLHKVLPYDPYMEAKREFLVTPDITIWDLAKKHHLDFYSLNDMAKAENWPAQRGKYLDLKLEKVLQEKKKHIDEEDEKIGTFMIGMALRSLRKRRRVPLSFKESKDFIVEGNRIRRQALGMEKGSPKIVNIISQQQAIIDKYKVKK